jgi:hypothetical protein
VRARARKGAAYPRSPASFPGVARKQRRGRLTVPARTGKTEPRAEGREKLSGRGGRFPSQARARRNRTSAPPKRACGRIRCPPGSPLKRQRKLGREAARERDRQRALEELTLREFGTGDEA